MGDLGNAIIYLFNVAADGRPLRNIIGIWLEAAIEFALFVTAQVIARQMRPTNGLGRYGTNQTSTLALA